MKELTIVIPESPSNLSSIIGAYMIFIRAEGHWRGLGNDPVFNISLAGTADGLDLYDGLFSIHPRKRISEIHKTDLIVIPALMPGTEYKEQISLNRQLINWISDQYKSGSEVLSICTGAFLLAATGLMKGKSCSTHWFAAGSFREMFPEVRLVADRIITDENGIYTSGGAFSFLNFLLYVVEKKYDRQTAIFCSKIFEIDMDRFSQSPFAVFQVQKNHGDETIRKAQEYLENNFREKISVDSLSLQLAVGRRNFDRRFKKMTGNSPAEYLQRIKVEAAKKQLETSRKNISEVMYDVGYSDLKAFRLIFKKITGLSPVEYRKKYNRDAAIINT